jgi:hypothetical protein
MKLKENNVGFISIKPKDKLKTKGLVLVLLFFCHSPIILAGYSYMHFDASKISINQELFKRYIKPQLKTLTQEYGSLLKRFGPLETEFINLRQEAEQFAIDWMAWRPECKFQTIQCQNTLQEFHERARSLDLKLMTLRNSKLDLTNFPNNIDHILQVGQHVDTMIIYNYRLLHRLEEMVLATKLGHQNVHNIYVNVTPYVDKLRIYSELILFGALPGAFAVEFDTVWTHFISPLENKVVREESLDFLLRTLGDLNLTWNTFHMRMTKSSLPQNKENNQLLGVMHNRWTSVVRLLLTSYRDGMKGQDEKEIMIETVEGE